MKSNTAKSETILKMQGIQKHFFGVHALKVVDFDLKSGEVYALMGENGAGNSTLIKSSAEFTRVTAAPLNISEIR